LKKLITFRFDPELLAHARKTAQQQNRTLTNFVETVLKKALEGAPSADEQTNADKSDSGV
jgi:predicted HicB family RNase H-like nuclease